MNLMIRMAKHSVEAKNWLSTMAVNGPLNFIGGKRCAPADSSHSFPVIQPASGKVLTSVPASGRGDVDSAVCFAQEAFSGWSRLSGFERGRLLTTAAERIREKLEAIAQLEVLDTGKPIWEARVDVAACADLLQYYGGVAAAISGLHHQLSGGSFAHVRREPLGVVAGIGAWNYPFQAMMWKVAPALACGNSFVFKPSQLTPFSAVVLAETLTNVGVPPGVVNVVQGESETGATLCSHPGVAKVTFTGSVPTGQAIMRTCADGMKKVTLELGGKSALLVFADADLEEAVKATMIGNFLTQGEVCTNCTRVFVERSIAKPFTDLLVAATKKMVIGDPTDDKTTVGATISAQHAQSVLSYVQEAKKNGARILCGGERVLLDDPELKEGFYLSPCVIDECTDEMKVVREEIFGSVACILPFDSGEDEAVARANQSPFGLAAGVMTKDLVRAHRVANGLQAGIVWINNYNVFPVEVPFGGYKMSGFGRENGLEAVNDFTQLKTVYVEMNPKIDCPIYRP